ncbi:MAG TPA: hypothetical protein VGX23_18380 [Actinocrinis sp.]|nr:hypothetical protein [Actinocrinis sp.]
MLIRFAYLAVTNAFAALRLLPRSNRDDSDIDPAPQRSSTPWASFLRGQAEAIVAGDFFETVTMTGQPMCERSSLASSVIRLSV